MCVCGFLIRLCLIGSTFNSVNILSDVCLCVCGCVCVWLFNVISFKLIENSKHSLFTNEFMKIMCAVKNSSC
jgi:hypothetical protein